MTPKVNSTIAIMDDMEWRLWANVDDTDELLHWVVSESISLGEMFATGAVTEQDASLIGDFIMRRALETLDKNRSEYKHQS